MLQPKRFKFRKVHRGHRRGMAHTGNTIAFGEYGIQALEPAWITARQIEAARRAITHTMRRGGKGTTEPLGALATEVAERVQGELHHAKLAHVVAGAAHDGPGLEAVADRFAAMGADLYAAEALAGLARAAGDRPL